jgi:hypothetical protein
MSSRSPRQERTIELMKRLEDLITLFEDAATRGCGRAIHSLVCPLFHCNAMKSEGRHHQPTMRSLREKASDCIENASTQGASANQHSGALWALDELVGLRTSPDTSSPLGGENVHIVEITPVLTRYAVPGRDIGRTGEAFPHSSQPAAQESTSRPGTGSRRTAGSSSYPGYLHGAPRGETSTSLRPRAREDGVPGAIQLPELSFVVQPLRDDPTTADWEHPNSNLSGQ